MNHYTHHYTNAIDCLHREINPCLTHYSFLIHTCFESFINIFYVTYHS